MSEKLTIYYDDATRFRKMDDLNWNLERLLTVQSGDNAGKRHGKPCPTIRRWAALAGAWR